MDKLSPESRATVRTCSVDDLEQIIFDLRDESQAREDGRETSALYARLGLDFTEFCRLKRPGS